MPTTKTGTRTYLRSNPSRRYLYISGLGTTSMCLYTIQVVFHRFVRQLKSSSTGWHLLSEVEDCLLSRYDGVLTDCAPSCDGGLADLCGDKRSSLIDCCIPAFILIDCVSSCSFGSLFHLRRVGLSKIIILWNTAEELNPSTLC